METTSSQKTAMNNNLSRRTVILILWRVEPVVNEGSRGCFFKSFEGVVVPGRLRGAYMEAIESVDIGQVVKCAHMNASTVSRDGKLHC